MANRLFHWISGLVASILKRGTPHKKYEVIVQQWDQFESDWGRTHGGYSVHLSEADRLAFIADEEERGHRRSTYFIQGSVPWTALVDKATYKKAKTLKKGLFWPDDSEVANWGQK